MTEQQIKKYMAKFVCPRCVDNMKYNNPNMIDCAYRQNNDEHLCKKAKGYEKV